MIKNLNLPVQESEAVLEKTKLWFKDYTQFRTPEALILYEQRIMNEDRILDLCQQEYNCLLDTPQLGYVPRDTIEKFRAYDVFVVSQSLATNTVVLGMLPEHKDQLILVDEYNIERVFVPIYYYVKCRTAQYGRPEFLMELPAKDIWDLVVQEAIRLGASDITVSTAATGGQVYYNVRKAKVRSHRSISKQNIEDIIQILSAQANATLAELSTKPRFFSVNLDKHNRGRVVVNQTYYGMLMTIRVLPNAFLRTSLEELNLEPSTIKFIREVFLSKEKGLRLAIGETMSGKNTTILSALNELVATDKYKIVSLEQPVELLVDGIEQINAETDEEFEANADSLLRQNPDIVYFTEITARTAEAIMKQSNTSKAVFSSLHANSISDVLFRLSDITHMSLDRLLLTVQSCIYQELVRDDIHDTVRPVTRCLHFDDELKMQLYGKSIGEISAILKERERAWS